MQSIAAINKTVKVKSKRPNAGDNQIIKGRLNRELCMKYIVNGVRDVKALAELMNKHIKTLLGYLKEFAANGLIELVIGLGLKTKIVNVL